MFADMAKVVAKEPSTYLVPKHGCRLRQLEPSAAGGILGKRKNGIALTGHVSGSS